MTNHVNSPIGWNNYLRGNFYTLGRKTTTATTTIIMDWDSKKKIMYDFTCKNVDFRY